MNIHPVFCASTEVPQYNAPEKKVETISFPREIAIRIRAVNLLAHRIVYDIAPSFCRVIDCLDHPISPTAFEDCEALFQDAFIHEFSTEEVDLFLGYFFDRFDPNHVFICYEKLNSSEGKAFLWKSIIHYYCTNYVGFDTKATPLHQAFDHFKNEFDLSSDIILINPLEYAAQLEASFDCSMNVIPKFSADETIQMKLLSISYAALIIASLKKVADKEDPKEVLTQGFSLEDLFEEIIAMILQLPFAPLETVPLSQRYHETLDELSPELLKKKFLEELVAYVLSPEDPLYEQNASAIQEVISQSNFLDFEIKEILANIKLNSAKKK